MTDIKKRIEKLELHLKPRPIPWDHIYSALEEIELCNEGPPGETDEERKARVIQSIGYTREDFIKSKELGSFQKTSE
ncbi:MAG: hypothetical protein ABSB79_14860 [Syntrophales bacterium]|jgi:hypothetical protein